MAQRRTFSEEFKREAVGLSWHPGAKISEVAHDIGVGADLLWRWRGAMGLDCYRIFKCSIIRRYDWMIFRSR